MAKAKKSALKVAASTETIEAYFKHAKETKGAHQFIECDSNGEPVEDYKEAKIGSIYLRKSCLPEGVTPKFLKVSVSLSN